MGEFGRSRATIMVGRTVSHYRILEKAYEGPTFFMTVLKVDPEPDTLPSDPPFRFRDLLHGMNLP